jgi:hypothetical protein
MCGRLATIYRECGCTRAGITRACLSVKEYQGAACSTFQNKIVPIPGWHAEHLQDYLGTGGDDWSHYGGVDDPIDTDEAW